MPILEGLGPPPPQQAFCRWNDPSGTELIGLNRDGSIYAFGGILFGDGTTQTSASSGGDGDFLPLAGGTMIGIISGNVSFTDPFFGLVTGGMSVTDTYGNSFNMGQNHPKVGPPSDFFNKTTGSGLSFFILDDAIGFYMVSVGGHLVYDQSITGIVFSETGTGGISFSTINSGIQFTALAGGFNFQGGDGFGNLSTPINPPTALFASLGTMTAVIDGSLVYCLDAMGPQDLAVWGSTAGGSGTGALLRYTTQAGGKWMVIG